jgi:hypothetical protein
LALCKKAQYVVVKVDMPNIYSRASLMNVDVNDEVPNETPKALIPSDGVLNWDGVMKLRDKLEGDHATH